MISDVMKSNLFTMGLVAKVNPVHRIGEPYTMPDEETRRLRARLVLEEALETVNGLGFDPFVDDGKHRWYLGINGIKFERGSTGDLDLIIDGSCDTIYVAVGTLASCGVPDLPHLAEVCRANDAKFPGGAPILDAGGKFLKPPGWTPPDHEAVRRQVEETGFRLKGDG